VRADWVALDVGGSAAARAPVGATVPSVPAPQAPTLSAPAVSAGATAASAVPSAGRGAEEIYRGVAERLRALDKLRSDGLITEAEYQEKRRQLLRDL
jgi:Short C-terminal domain